MQNGGSKTTNKIDEIDEYFQDPIDTDETDEAMAFPSQNNRENHGEELRRLSALVAHLRDQVREFQSTPNIDDSGQRNESIFPFISKVLFASGLVGALLTLQTRKLHRR